MGKTATVMIKVHIVTIKSYYVDANGYDHQVADGDSIPYVYTNRAKAIKRAKDISKQYCERWGYEVTIPDAENPAKKDDVCFAERIEKILNKERMEIRVYTENTWD